MGASPLLISLNFKETQNANLHSGFPAQQKTSCTVLSTGSIHIASAGTLPSTSWVSYQPFLECPPFSMETC